MTFDVRLRLHKPDGTRQRVLKTLTHEWVGVESATPTIRFSVSSRVAGYLTAPLVVGYEYSVDGGAWKSPRNNLFVAEEEDADSVDPTGVVTFTGIGLVPWLLSRTYLHWSTSAKNGERDWIQFPYGDTGSATPGHMLNGMLVESKNRGWGPHITWDFSALKDSNGKNWSLAGDDLWWEPWKLLTPISTVLEQVAQGGFCEWWSEGHKLRMSVPGAGVDRTDSVVLGGPGFTRAPGKASFQNVFTHLTVVPEKARHWLYLTNTGANSSFGRLEATMTQSGVEKHDRATKLAQPVLTNGRNLLREQSYEWTPNKSTRLPFRDFNIGDEVTTRTRGGKDRQRVIGLVIAKNGEVVTVRAVTGHKLLGRTTKLLQRVGKASMGGVIGGTGNAFPAPVAPRSDEPIPPVNLTVTENTAVWGEDGSGLATITLTWTPVTETTLGNRVDISDYEVWERRPDEADARRVTATLGPKATIRLVSGESRVWTVRARSTAGVWSEFSTEVFETAATPASIVPKAPTELTVASNTGVFRDDGTAVSTVTVTWSPVTLSVDEIPVTVAEYEVSAGLETLRATGASVSFTVPTGAMAAVTVRARTSLGVWSDPSSPPLEVTGAAPVQVSTAPNPPTLTTGAGGVFIHTDALLTTGPPPAGYQGIFAEYRIGTTGEFSRVAGALARGAGQVGQVRAAIGDVVQARLRWVDALGRVSNVSDLRQITVKGIEIPDFDPEMNIAELIQANGILADQIQMDQGFADKFWANEGNFGQISVDMVAPNFGDSLNLEANGTINLIAGQVDGNANALAEQEQALNAQAVELAAAQAAAQAASQGAADAGIAAAAAQAAALAAQEVADTLALALVVSETDVRVTRPGGAMAVHISDQDLSIRRNGVAKTWWDEQQMIVPKLKATQVVVGQTVITEGAGRTTWQRL